MTFPRANNPLQTTNSFFLPSLKNVPFRRFNESITSLFSMEKVISGIQQIGIGIPDVQKATNWYRHYFGMDIKVFEDSATADLMTPYTGGEAHDRTAVLALNMKGGGGFEIWQYTSREPQPADFDLMMGDLGINVGKIKSINVPGTYDEMEAAGLDILTPLEKNPAGDYNFFVKDLYGNLWQVVKGLGFFKEKTPSSTGGVVGAIIGTTDVEEARKLYTTVLGYDEVVYDKTAVFADFKGLPGGKDTYRRVLLRHSKPRQGGFSKMFGPTEIELIEVQGRQGRKLYDNRYWGDLGFIHLCFDVQGMDALKKELEEKGFPFTVDSAGSFDMGEAAGRFTYVEDPDGTLIEFVETHKVPIIEKIGCYINMTKRDPKKDLPGWVMNGLALNRMKDPDQKSTGWSAATKTGILFLSLWVVFNIFILSGEADISTTSISSWPLFIAFTAGSFLIPYGVVKAVDALFGKK